MCAKIVENSSQRDRNFFPAITCIKNMLKKLIIAFNRSLPNLSPYLRLSAKLYVDFIGNPKFNGCRKQRKPI